MAATIGGYQSFFYSHLAHVNQRKKFPVFQVRFDSQEKGNDNLMRKMSYNWLFYFGRTKLCLVWILRCFIHRHDYLLNSKYWPESFLGFKENISTI